MSQDFQHNAHARHAKQAPNGRKIAPYVGGIVGAVLLLVAIGVAAWVLLNPEVLFGPSYTPSSTTQTALNESSSESQTITDSSIETSEQESEVVISIEEEPLPDYLPTPLIAEYDGVLLHCPIAPKDLQGIIFHQASFETAHVVHTELPSADIEEIEQTFDYKIAEEQPTGDEYLDAQALHLWREGAQTDMDTSVDVGAEAGTQVYSPVTGTVVKVNEYDLYDVCKDYEVHIQPDGRPDLDVVEIHISDVSVKAGDKVIGGQTPIALVRDIAAEDITDIQLAYYTKEGHGNHTHFQVNNADYPEYRETRLKDAYKVE